MPIQYVKGDATEPKGSGNKIICHVVNDIGKWGRGFVLAVSKKWKEPEQEYHSWYANRNIPNHFELGKTQLVKVAEDIWVANMIGQHLVWRENGIPPIRYDALRKCLKALCKEAKYLDAAIHAPRFGAGLAGGDWKLIEPIIIEELCDQSIPVFIYDLAERHSPCLSIK